MKKLYGADDPMFPWIFHPGHVYEYGLELGIPSSQLLQAAGLTTSVIERLDLRLTWQQYCRMLRCVEQFAHTPDEWMFQLGRKISPASHGLVSLVILNCTNIRQVVDVLSEYLVFATPMFYIRQRLAKDCVYLTVHPSFTRDRYLERLVLPSAMILYRTIRQVCQMDVRGQPEQVCVMLESDPPAFQQQTRRFFHDSVRWNQPTNQLRLSRALYDSQTVACNPLSAENMRRLLQAQLEQLPSRKGVLHELSELFRQGIYRQDECARRLLTSTPTLKRYLSTANTSFSRELTCFRIEEACWVLQHSQDTVGQISDWLGFQDVASFRRLFKKEMGMSPSGYRRHCELSM